MHDLSTHLEQAFAITFDLRNGAAAEIRQLLRQLRSELNAATLTHMEMRDLTERKAKRP